MPFINSIFIMEDSYYTNSPYHIPAYNYPQLLPSTYIHPESAAGQLGPTWVELALILHEQQEYLQDKLAQPPQTFTRPTTHPILATMQLGLTKKEIEEVLEGRSG